MGPRQLLMTPPRITSWSFLMCLKKLLMPAVLPKSHVITFGSGISPLPTSEGITMPKLAVCFQGGGSRGTYSAGAIEILLRNEIIADEVYGTSCGALMACNYVSQEPTRAYEQTLFLANDKHFFHPFSLFSKGTMFDYAYLFNVI